MMLKAFDKSMNSLFAQFMFLDKQMIFCYKAILLSWDFLTHIDWDIHFVVVIIIKIIG